MKLFEVLKKWYVSYCRIIKNTGYKRNVVLQPLTVTFVTKLATRVIPKSTSDWLVKINALS